MKKLSPIAYRALFFKHVWRFIGKLANPFELQGPHLVAVSGGLDSMTLLWFINTLHRQGKLGPVRAIHVHHHTRVEQDDEAALIQKFCDQEKIPLEIVHAQGLSASDSNFEAKARKARIDLVTEKITAEDTVWAGHHLDDSYEWSLMQRSRSGSYRAIHGIPVRNGPLVRPFLCVTKAQIKKLAKFEGIEYVIDPTNSDLRYDRNYLRASVIPLIKKRFPKYLKHYAHNANFATLLLRNNVLSRSGASDIYAFEKGAVLIGKHFTEIQIQELLHTYSNTDRGEIVHPIQRMLKAIDNDKKGPFHFSGGLMAYHTHSLLMIYPKNFKNYDSVIARVLETLPLNLLHEVASYKRVELEHSWENVLKAPDAMCNMPGLILILESESICKTLNCSVYDVLFPEVSRVCQSRGLKFITYVKCIETWRSKKERLPEKLRLLPLNNLSNLFSSQQ